MTAPSAEALSQHIVVCGLGHVGFRIASLLGRLGEPFAVIAGATRDEWSSVVAGLAPLASGDARDERLLRGAGIERARVVLAVTDDDRANVSIALDAKRLNPSIAVVVRLFDQQLAPLLESSLGNARALSASALAAPGFVAAALGAGVLGAFEFGGRSGLIEELQIHQGESRGLRTVGSLLAGASRGDVIGMVLRMGLWLIGFGLAVGVAASLAVSKVLASEVAGVSVRDPLTFLAVCAVVIGAGTAACWFPAMRATRIDPMIALRFE